MCKLFVGADPTLWESRSRSLRIDGVVTSLRLENFFWQILEEIGARDGLNVPRLIAILHDESTEAGHDPRNLTSFLRVCAGRYLELIAAGELSSTLDEPLRDVPVMAILDAEALRRQQKAGEIARFLARANTLHAPAQPGARVSSR